MPSKSAPESKSSPVPAAMTEQHGPLPPHQVLTEYYAEAAQRRTYIDQLFDRSARHYDWINGLMSFGSGRRYRRLALLRAGLKPGMQVLDVGCGTGVIAALAADIVGAQGQVSALDPSAGMLAETAQRASTAAGSINVVQGLGESLPFADARFDFVVMGYALRHVADLHQAFTEYRRVLKPGGRLLLLEISRPESRLGYVVLKGYLKHVIPTLTRLLRRSPEAQTLMVYYWATIEHCVEPAAILAALHEAGLEQVARRVELGVFSDYTAQA